MNKDKLRLILFEECHRDCDGCCNKDWDLKNLPVCNDFRGYDLIMLTGGEPMLRPDIILGTIERIRSQTKAPVVLYTALLEDKVTLGKLLDLIDGITITLHAPEDIIPFMDFDSYYPERADVSFRLNVFKGVGSVKCSSRWKVKDNIVWIKDCPLPDGETLMRLDIAGIKKTEGAEQYKTTFESAFKDEINSSCTKRLRIYQVNTAREPTLAAFMGLEFIIARFGTIPAHLYGIVFDGDVGTDNPGEIFRIFNVEHPIGYTGRSLSVSDVIELYDETGCSFLFCDSYGFKPVTFDSSLCEREKQGGQLNVR